MLTLHAVAFGPHSLLTVTLLQAMMYVKISMCHDHVAAVWTGMQLKACQTQPLDPKLQEPLDDARAHPDCRCDDDIIVDCLLGTASRQSRWCILPLSLI